MLYPLKQLTRRTSNAKSKRPRQPEPLFIKGQRARVKGQKQEQKTKFKKKKHKIQS